MRESRRRRWVLTAAIAVIVIVILVPAYGYYREIVRLGDTTTATVDSRTISLEQEARYVGTRQAFVAKQIAQVPPVAQPTPATPGAKTTPTANTQAAQQLLQTLQSEQVNLPSAAQNSLVEANLVLDESQARGLTASQTELDNGLRWLLSPHQPASAASAGIDPVPATLPISGTVTLDVAKQELTAIVGTGRFLSADQITELVVKPAVLKEKLIAATAGNIATTGEQVHARHILVSTLEEAQTIKKELDGGADFAIEAAKSTDTGSKDKGGDLGWFGRGQMVPAFEQAAFSLNVGQISDPVKSNFGYHIIQVIEKDPNRPLDPARVEQLREQGYETWLGKAQSDTTKVTLVPSTPRMSTWILQYVNQPNP